MTSTDDSSTGGARPVQCSRCGASAAPAPITWVLEVDPRRGSLYYCDRCARENLRSIEGRLPQEYW